jgi:hypothetical protein
VSRVQHLIRNRTPRFCFGKIFSACGSGCVAGCNGLAVQFPPQLFERIGAAVHFLNGMYRELKVDIVDRSFDLCDRKFGTQSQTSRRSPE